MSDTGNACDLASGKSCGSRFCRYTFQGGKLATGTCYFGSDEMGIPCPCPGENTCSNGVCKYGVAGKKDQACSTDADCPVGSQLCCESAAYMDDGTASLCSWAGATCDLTTTTC